MNTELIVNNVEKFFGSDNRKILGFFFVRKMDKDGNFSFPYISEGAKGILGVDENISFNQYLGMIHFGDKDNYLRHINQSLKDMKEYVEEYRILSAKNGVRWLKGAVNVREDIDGSFVWEGVLIDNTVIKRTEEWLETTFNNAPEGIITFNEQGEILSANDTMQNLFGYREKELVGNNVSMLIKKEHAEYFSEYIKNYLSIDTNKEPPTFRDYEGMKKNGSFFPVEFSLNDVKSEGILLFILIIRDITERKRIENTLKETEIKLSNIVSAMPCAFFTTEVFSNGEHKTLYLSKGARFIFNIKKDDFTKNKLSLSEYMSSEDAEDLLFFRISLFENDKLDKWEREIKLNNGKWVHIRTRVERLKGGRILNHGVVIDITDQKKDEEKIKYLAYNDPMTNTGNRAFLMKEFPRFIDSANRHEKRFAVISIIPINIGTFYANSGYDIGDKLMAEAARRIKILISPKDCLTYVSGSRFVLLKGGVSSLKEIEEVCLSIQHSFDTSLIVDNQEFDVNIKIGVSIYPDHNTDCDILLRYSEVALANTKLDFQGEYLVFTEEMKANLTRNMVLKAKLKHAIANQEIVPYFQAQVDVKSGEIIGMEVLARWVDKEEGFIPPNVFIPIAEEYGLIESLTNIIVENSCRINKRWIDMGLARVPIAVNVSGKHEPNALLDLIDRMLNEVKIPADCLEVELTESSMMDDPSASKKTMEKLLEMGVACSIDDFGTGYSSLSMLNNFPIKKLKIDRSFVLGIDKENGFAIINATIAMAKALNLLVLAEGVDNKNHFKYLKDQGCEIIQGYLFSKPVSEKEMEEKLRTWDSKKEIEMVN